MTPSQPEPREAVELEIIVGGPAIPGSIGNIPGLSAAKRSRRLAKLGDQGFGRLYGG